MNYISHHEVAHRYDSFASSDFLFGSFAADFARMSNTRKQLAHTTNPEVIEGMIFHRYTNKPAFDDQPEIVSLETDIENSFKSFLPWRTARQASRAGKDLLFDGIQFNEPGSIEDLLITLDCVLAGKVALSGIDDPTPLLEVAKWVVTHGPPRYDNARVVTERLFTTLSRTRTPLPPETFNNVLGVLETHQPTVFAIGPVAMKQTVENLETIYSRLP